MVVSFHQSSHIKMSAVFITRKSDLPTLYIMVIKDRGREMKKCRGWHTGSHGSNIVSVKMSSTPSPYQQITGEWRGCWKKDEESYTHFTSKNIFKRKSSHTH